MEPDSKVDLAKGHAPEVGGKGPGHSDTLDWVLKLLKLSTETP